MKKNKDFVAGVLFSLTNSLSLGILGAVDKIGAEHYANSIVFSLQSVFFSLLFVTFFSVFYFKKSLIRNVKAIPFSLMTLIIFVGIFASGLYILFRFIGLTQSTGTFATLAQVVITAETAIAAFIFLKEKLSKIFWFLFVIILIAIYFVSVGKLQLTTLHRGDVIIMIGASFVTFANIFSKLVVKKINPVMLSEGRFLFGSVFLLIVALLFFHQTNLFAFSIWSVISGFFWAINVIAFNFAIKKIGVTLTTSLLMIAPIYTMLLEYFILKQTFNSLQITAAFVVIIGGILMVILKNN